MPHQRSAPIAGTPRSARLSASDLLPARKEPHQRRSTRAMLSSPTESPRDGTSAVPAPAFCLAVARIEGLLPTGMKQCMPCMPCTPSCGSVRVCEWPGPMGKRANTSRSRCTLIHSSGSSRETAAMPVPSARHMGTSNDTRSSQSQLTTRRAKARQLLPSGPFDGRSSASSHPQSGHTASA